MGGGGGQGWGGSRAFRFVGTVIG